MVEEKRKRSAFYHYHIETKLPWSEILFSSYPSWTKYGSSSSPQHLLLAWLAQMSVFPKSSAVCSNLSSTKLPHLKTLQSLCTICRTSTLPASPSLTLISSHLVSETLAALNCLFLLHKFMLFLLHRAILHVVHST